MAMFGTTCSSEDHLLSIAFSCLLLLHLLLLSSVCTSTAEESAKGEVKGMFVFGSSLVDNGNNNFLKNSIARADYLPYGVDFPSGPSGRFTNGKNVIDLLCDQLRLPLIPAFEDPLTKGENIVHGVNHASGASGILDDTGSIAGEVISLSQQIKNFEEVTLPGLELQLGNDARELLEDYLFVVGSGGNDYSFNYFVNPMKSNVSLQVFTANLTQTFFCHLQKLYELGGRKFVLMSINPIGCSPLLKLNKLVPVDSCLEGLNKAAHLFNTRLVSLMDDLKPQMPASNLVFVNSYKMITDILRDPLSKGFTDKNNPCCEVIPRIEGGNGVLCKENGVVCKERCLHVYFDGLHPTEAVNIEIATKAYFSNRASEVYPFNIKQLSIM